MPGESVTGDQALVAVADTRVLVAAADGLGHGVEAAAAAEAVMRVLRQSADRDVVEAVGECHRALLHTRGATLSLASFDCRRRTLEWLGIGNVEARLLRVAGAVPVAESLMLQSGIVGHELPRLSPQTRPLTMGDVLILATDGIQRDFADFLVPSGSCDEIADRILAQSAIGSDDALVLVARYLGKT